MTKQVIPLESNPQIFTDLAYKLGLSPILQFHDIYSLPEAPAFLPSPVYAVILLFPISESQNQEGDISTSPNLKRVSWFKQTIGNACGLYALLHVLTNLPNDLIIKNLIIGELMDKVVQLENQPQQIVNLVEQLESKIGLDENYGVQGQTEAPAKEDDINLHFITFIKGKDGHLYELDGRKNGPIDLGECDQLITDEKLNNRVQYYMNSVDQENVYNFAMMGIAPTLD